jgi:hypothetical protein
MGGLTLALALGGLGCGGSNPSGSQAQGSAPLTPANSGTLTVKLVQDGNPGTLSHLNLVLGDLQVRVGGVWRPVPLTVPGQTIDLMAATSQSPVVLAAQVPWPVGSNDALQFSVGAGGTVQFSTDDPDTTHNLAAPQGLSGLMGLPGSFTVTAQTGTELWITFDVENVVLPDGTENGGYVLLPGPIRGYDKGATGQITGTLTTQAVAGPPAVAAAPLGAAAVTAQLQFQDGQPGAAIAFRSVQADASGAFTLDLLPKGYTWCVVSQPVIGTAVYYPQASPGFALGDAPTDTYATSLAFLTAPVPGILAGTVGASPGVGQEDVVDLIQEIPIGGVPYRFVIGSAAVVTAKDGFSFSFPAVPPGTYSAVLNDYTQVSGQGLVDQPEASGGFVVSAGAKTNLSF